MVWEPGWAWTSVTRDVASVRSHEPTLRSTTHRAAARVVLVLRRACVRGPRAGARAQRLVDAAGWRTLRADRGQRREPHGRSALLQTLQPAPAGRHVLGVVVQARQAGSTHRWPGQRLTSRARAGRREPGAALGFPAGDLTDRFLVPFFGFGVGYEWLMLHSFDHRTGAQEKARYANLAWQTFAGV